MSFLDLSLPCMAKIAAFFLAVCRGWGGVRALLLLCLHQPTVVITSCFLSPLFTGLNLLPSLENRLCPP